MMECSQKNHEGDGVRVGGNKKGRGKGTKNVLRKKD